MKEVRNEDGKNFCDQIRVYFLIRVNIIMKLSRFVLSVVLALDYALFPFAYGDKMYLRLDRMPETGDEILTQIGWLEVGKELGGGVFGSVFEAFCERLNLPVALKVEKPRSFGKYVPNDENLKDFSHITHEYRIMKELNNTRGFPIVYTGLLDGELKYYAMELLGDDLESVLRKSGGRLTKKAVRLIGVQVLSGLRSLHQRGYLMNDLHLGNLLLGKHGTVYITDLAWAIRFELAGRHIPPKHSRISRFSRSRRDELLVFLRLLASVNTGLDFENEKSVDMICAGESWWLRPAFYYVSSLYFEDEPDYDLVARLIVRL